MNIDLHCHTKMSDGSTGIGELIDLAKLRQIETLAVTDHDTFACSVRAVVLGKRAGVTVVPGVEISTLDHSRGKRAHLLCYYPKNAGRLEGLLRKITENRRAAMSISIQKVLHIYPMPMTMILTRAHGSTNIFKQHVMQALMDAGYTDEIFGNTFKKLFHPKYGLAYTRIEYPDVFDVIEEIHSAGGAAVLAHPSEYESMDLMQELCEKGLLEGIEGFHPRNSDEDLQAILNCCQKYQLPMTGGTDFHGCYTTACLPLGSYLTPENQFELLKKKKIS